MDEEEHKIHEEFRRVIDHHLWEAQIREKIALQLRELKGKSAYTYSQATYHQRLGQHAETIYSPLRDRAPLRHYLNPTDGSISVSTNSFACQCRR